MNYKDKKKLTSLDKRKIENRYNSKLEEYRTKTIEELKVIFNTVKLSSTDRWALIAATDELMKKQIAETTKINKEIEGE